MNKNKKHKDSPISKQFGGQFRGWSKSKRHKTKCFKCPHCQKLFDLVFFNSQGVFKCYRCNTQLHEQQLLSTKRMARVLVCSVCNKEVILSEGTILLSGLGYGCSDGCVNIVAVKFKGHVYQPRTVFRVSWNTALDTKGRRIGANSRIVKAISEKDFLIIHLMQLMAKEEGEPFMSARKGDHYCALLFEPETDSYLGYIIWNGKEYACLRQIFVMPNFRRKGYASAMLNYWVKNYADKIAPKFGIESPNEKSISMLMKLGYLIKKADKITSEKCFRVQGL